MASINFYTGENFSIYDVSASGLGFFGDGFGISVPITSPATYNSRTFITNSVGTVEGPEVDNVKYVSSTGAVLGQTGVPILLTQIPNYLSTLNVRFEHSTGVRTTNAEFRIFDRTNINNPPSGVTCRIAEIIHPATTQTNVGSGDTTWVLGSGSGSKLLLVDSPGASGNSPSGISTIDTRHDWYIAISASPDVVGARTQFGAYAACEYL